MIIVINIKSFNCNMWQAGVMLMILTQFKLMQWLQQASEENFLI